MKIKNLIIKEEKMEFWIVGWFMCGFIGYGLTKGNWYNFYSSREFIGYGARDEFLSCILLLLGLMGLIFALIFCSTSSDGFGWCLKMPKELKIGYRERYL